MAKYQVTVPSPSAKRMAGNGKVIVTYHDGWTGDSQDVYPISGDTVIFTFEVPDQYEWIHSTSIIDGMSFSVEARYTNPTGSRTEVHKLVPEKAVNQ